MMRRGVQTVPGCRQDSKVGAIRSTLDWLVSCLILLTISIGATVGVTVINTQAEHYAWAHWQVRELSVAELSHMPESLIVDARSHQLFAEAHVPGALWLSEEGWDDGLPSFLDRWHPEHPVVIYCDGRACAASKRVALRLLADLPDARVYVLKGGFAAWQATQN
jgi:rhodanese-related sulfurtransferase